MFNTAVKSFITNHTKTFSVVFNFCSSARSAVVISLSPTTLNLLFIMQRMMFKFIKNSKVFWTVIVFDTVDMMYNFAWKKFAANHFLGNDPVFPNLFVILITNKNIAERIVGRFPAIRVCSNAAAPMGTKPCPTGFNYIGANGKFFAAQLANFRNITSFLWCFHSLIIPHLNACCLGFWFIFEAESKKGMVLNAAE